MIIDSGKEQQSLESIRFEKASHAHYDLLFEISDLNEDQITEGTAPFIASLLLARALESHFLDILDVQKMNVGNLAEREGDRRNKEITSYQFQVLREAREGNFSKLKNYVGEKAEEWAGVAEEYEEGSKEHQGYSEISRKFKLIAERTPKNGKKLANSAPNPAHMEEPVPLRIQLERFMKGEPIR